jgi:hypothetical protein
MKSTAIIAFGLLVLIAVAVANPIEEDDETIDHATDDLGDQSKYTSQQV